MAWKSENRNSCRSGDGNPEGKRQLARPRRKRGGYVKMDFAEMGWEFLDWVA